MRIFLTGVCITGVCALFALFSGSAAMAQQQVTADEIRADIIGNTITMTTERMDKAMGLIEADGTMRGEISGERFEGRWSIRDGDILCFDLPGEKFDICRRVVRNKQTVVFFTLTGDPRGKVEVLQGNPHNF